MTSDPYPKSRQLARGERRYRRRVASPKQWQAIIAAKGPECRLAGVWMGHGNSRTFDPVQYHHLVPRSLFGDDLADNIVPLCRRCHDAISTGYPSARILLAESLSDAEYAYVVGKLGEGAMGRLFGV